MRRLSPIARIRRLVAGRAARDAAAILLDRVQASDGDILALTMPVAVSRAGEIRMKLALRKALDDRRLFRTSVVLLDEGVTLRIERASARQGA